MTTISHARCNLYTATGLKHLQEIVTPPWVPHPAATGGFIIFLSTVNTDFNLRVQYWLNGAWQESGFTTNTPANEPLLFSIQAPFPSTKMRGVFSVQATITDAGNGGGGAGDGIYVDGALPAMGLKLLVGGLVPGAHVGQYVIIAGAADAANNGTFLITANTADVLSYENAAGVDELTFGQGIRAVPAYDVVVDAMYTGHFQPT